MTSSGKLQPRKYVRLISLYSDLKHRLAGLAAFICGFLNQGEGGELLIGVEEGGRVRGLSLDRKRRDEARQQLDR